MSFRYSKEDCSKLQLSTKNKFGTLASRYALPKNKSVALLPRFQERY